MWVKKLKNKNGIFKYSKYIFLIALLVIMYAIHKYIFLYADDLYYSRDAVASMNNIPAFALEELKANGRVWIHFLLQILLLDKILYFRIVNPIVIVLVAFLIAKVSVGEFVNNKRFLIATGASSLFFLLLHIEISQDTLYYAACSLNYLYPMAVVILYGYMILKEYEKNNDGYKVNFFLIIIALFSGASSQQSGMIAIGFMIMTSIYYILVNRKKMNIKVLWYYVSLLLGYGTILFGSILRMKADKETGTKIVFLDTLSAVLKINIFSKQVAIFVIIISICSIFTILHYTNKVKANKSLYLINIGIIVAFITSIFMYVYIILYKGLIANLFEGSIKKIIFIIGFTGLYLIVNLYATTLILIKENKPMFFFCTVNAIGAQMMLLVADARYADTYRVMFPSLILMMIFVVYSIVKFFENKFFIIFLTLAIFINIVPIDRFNRASVLVKVVIISVSIILLFILKDNLKI